MIEVISVLKKVEVQSNAEVMFIGVLIRIWIFYCVIFNIKWTTIKIGFNKYVSCVNLIVVQYGRLAQLVRVPAS